MPVTEPLRHSVWIDAPPDRVFPFFTDAERLTSWLGDATGLEPHPGGRFVIDFGDAVVRGHYIDVDPPDRVVFTWGHAGSEQLPPGSSRVEVGLEPDRGGTTVTLHHHDLPPGERESHGRGWPVKLGQLVEQFASG